MSASDTPTPRTSELLSKNPDSCGLNELSDAFNRLVDHARTLERELAEAERQRDDLLARIFRDGGQKQGSFTTRQEACDAADLLVAEYIGQRDEYKQECEQEASNSQRNFDSWMEAVVQRDEAVKLLADLYGERSHRSSKVEDFLATLKKEG